jgi:hypothetical protein
MWGGNSGRRHGVALRPCGGLFVMGLVFSQFLRYPVAVGACPPMHLPGASRKPSTTLSPQGAGSEAFLGRFFANTLAMALVAGGMFFLMDSRDEGRRDDLTALREELGRLERDRARSQRLADALAQEAHDAGLAVEQARWEAREAARRLEAERALQSARNLRGQSAKTSAGRSPEVAVAPAVSLVRPEENGPASGAEVVADIPAGAGGDGDRILAIGPPGPLAEVPAERLEGGLALDEFGPRIPSLKGAYSQLDRDRAYANWKVLVEEAVASECGRRSSEIGAHRCSDKVRRSLFPFGPLAVSCSLSGNATPDYIPDVALSQLPSHSVPLEKGAIILCDGALENINLSARY